MLMSRQKDDSQEADKIRHQMNEHQVKMDEARKLKVKVATQVREAMFNLNEIELRAEASQAKLTQVSQQLDRVEPMHSTLRRLRKLVKEKDSKCFKGLLIDYIDCPQQFYGVLDVTVKQKLFSVIVDEMKDAEELLNLNKQIKGAVINIYPLELSEMLPVKSQPAQFPEGSIPLLSKVGLKAGADARL